MKFISSLPLLSLPDRSLNLVGQIPTEQAPSLPFLFAIILKHTVVDTSILSFHAQHRFRFLSLYDLQVRVSDRTPDGDKKLNIR